jgi:hypothetical protein
VEYIVRVHNMKFDSTIVSVGKMKILVNTNKRYVLMVMREKDSQTYDSFQGCDPWYKYEIIDVIYNYDEIFRELGGFPPKRGIQHEIYLQQDAPLPNVGMYMMLALEMEEVKK